MEFRLLRSDQPERWTSGLSCMAEHHRCGRRLTGEPLPDRSRMYLRAIPNIVPAAASPHHRRHPRPPAPPPPPLFPSPPARGGGGGGHVGEHPFLPGAAEPHFQVHERGVVRFHLAERISGGGDLVGLRSKPPFIGGTSECKRFVELFHGARLPVRRDLELLPKPCRF